FKVHVQVGRFDPTDPVLDPAWGVLADAGVPVVIHVGSRPIPGEFTGPERLAGILAKHPALTAVVAHLGMHEYEEFAHLAQRHPYLHLDSTMTGTDFVERFTTLPRSMRLRLSDHWDRVVLGSEFPSIP